MKEKAAANSTNPSIPAKAGISAAKPHSPTGDIGFRFAEFPADAGRDSRFRGNGIGDGNGRRGGNGSAEEAGIEVWRGRE